jgi:regulator of replication initiation timing
MKNNLFSRFIVLASAALVFVSPLSHSQSSPSTAEEVAKLKAENEKLRIESRRLRQMLTQSQAVPAAPAKPAAPLQPKIPASPAPATSPSTESAGLTHWITSSSGKRHNSGCRWYATTKGRKCSATEGSACLKCGG